METKYQAFVRFTVVREATVTIAVDTATATDEEINAAIKKAISVKSPLLATPIIDEDDITVLEQIIGV